MAKRKTEILALFQESYDMTKDLPDALFGKLMKAVCQYRFTGELVQIQEPEVRMALRFVVSQVDRYGDFCQQKREAAKERYNRQKEAALQGDAESCAEATEKEENIQQQLKQEEEAVQKDAEDPSISMSVSMSKSMSKSMSMSDSMSESMSMSDYKACTKNISGRKKEEREAAAAAPPPTQFIPPEVSEVEAYCKKAGIGIDARRFVDYYTSVGWMVGSCPIRDWKAVARNWSAKERSKPRSVELPPDWTIGHVL